MGFCAAAGEAYGSLPHGRVPLWEGPFGSSLCVCIPPGTSVIASQRGQAGDQPRRQGCTVLGRGLPLSGAHLPHSACGNPSDPPRTGSQQYFSSRLCQTYSKPTRLRACHLREAPTRGRTGWFRARSQQRHAARRKEGKHRETSLPYPI